MGFGLKIKGGGDGVGGVSIGRNRNSIGGDGSGGDGGDGGGGDGGDADARDDRDRAMEYSPSSMIPFAE